MTTPRYFATMTLLRDGRVLVAGGRDTSETPLASAELFNPATGQWTATGSMNQARVAAGAALLPDGRVLVAGGMAAPWDDLTSAEIYDPASGTWSSTGSLSVPRFLFQMQALGNGKVVAFGGYQQNTYAETASTEVFDPATGVWTRVGDMNALHAGFFSAVLQDGRVLAAGGCGYGGCPGYVTQTAELFDPATGTWATTSPTLDARSGATLTVLSDGRAFVAGGVGGPYWSEFSSSEIYDPSAGSWSYGAPMTAAREQNPVQALLPDGGVLVAGGYSSSGGRPASSEVYYPTTDSWQPAGGMRDPRSLASFVTLADGRVLAAGGQDNNGVTASAEIFARGGQAGPPQASFSYWPSTPSTFDTVQFYDQSSDPDLGAPIVARAWSFGDGTTSADASPTHRYAKDGSYTVKLTVTTDDQRSGSTTQSVTVRTHDIAITKLAAPTSAHTGQTSAITVNIANRHYAESVQIDLYKSTTWGFQWIDSRTLTLPVTTGNSTYAVAFNYTFTSDDAAAGKVSFQATANLLTAYDALSSDNTAISSPPTRVTH